MLVTSQRRASPAILSVRRCPRLPARRPSVARDSLASARPRPHDERTLSARRRIPSSSSAGASAQNGRRRKRSPPPPGKKARPSPQINPPLPPPPPPPPPLHTPT